MGDCKKTRFKRELSKNKQQVMAGNRRGCDGGDGGDSNQSLKLIICIFDATLSLKLNWRI